MSILDEIFDHKAVEVSRAKTSRPLAQVRAQAEQAAPPLDFTAALRRGSPAGRRSRPSSGGPALIAEIKCASPSRGRMAGSFDPQRLARIYQENGASAISVLTDERYFQGSLEHLRQVAALQPRLPLLRKDFLFDPYQVYEARAAGADAVLLIAAHLDPRQLCDLFSLAGELGLAALVEVHTRAELESVLQGCAPDLVGINNRDLHSFQVSLETTLDLLPCLPSSVCRVSESGIRTRADVERLAAAGVDAFLVGEALVASPDPGAMLRSLVC